MAKSGTRIQVFFSTTIADEFETISKAEGISLSKVVGDIINRHRPSEDYQRRLDCARSKRFAAEAQIINALEGTDISNEKIALILQALDEFQR